MMMTEEHIAGLLKRFREGKCTDKEVAELDDWFHNQKGGRHKFEAWVEEAGGEDQLTRNLYERFNQKIACKKRKQRKQVWYSAAAAAVVLIMAAAALFIPKQQQSAVNHRLVNTKKVTAPGTNKAILTLADGTQVNLSDAANGYLANQSGTRVKKAVNGGLVYERIGSESSTNNSEKLVYNTIATPRAGQYELELPDGTKVWLNAETTLRYPVKFNGTERRVELTGEAYFEVTPNKALPFRVTTAEQTITVLGTHFNIKGYADERTIATTLLEGSVSIANHVSGQSRLLVPGKQANITKGNGTILVANAHTDEVMAWKNGYFIFDNQDIKSIMRLISRWYDVDVDFKLTQNVRFGGTFSRSSDLKELLKNFELLGDLRFELKERRVTVSN